MPLVKSATPPCYLIFACSKLCGCLQYKTKNALRIWGALSLLWCKFASIKNENLRDPGPQAFGFFTSARAVFVQIAAFIIGQCHWSIAQVNDPIQRLFSARCFCQWYIYIHTYDYICQTTNLLWFSKKPGNFTKTFWQSKLAIEQQRCSALFAMFDYQ